MPLGLIDGKAALVQSMLAVTIVNGLHNDSAAPEPIAKKQSLK
jgi:hypothetical protein